jgi:hypothetical protein
MRQGYLPCSKCGRYGSEWVDVGGKMRAVTAPYDVSVGEGEEWTCSLCIEAGHEQEATIDDSKSNNLFQVTEVQ